MANLAKWFEGEADGPILFAVIGRDDCKRYSDRKSAPEYGKLLPWSEARTILDYEYNNGSADCHAVYAWTETRVLFVHEYYGSTSVQWVPRNPVACEPEFGGTWT